MNNKSKTIVDMIVFSFGKNRNKFIKTIDFVRRIVYYNICKGGEIHATEKAKKRTAYISCIHDNVENR